MENGPAEAPESKPDAKKPHVGAAAKNRCVYLDKSADEATGALLKGLKARDPSWSYSRVVNEALREYTRHHSVDELAPLPASTSQAESTEAPLS